MFQWRRQAYGCMDECGDEKSPVAVGDVEGSSPRGLGAPVQTLVLAGWAIRTQLGLASFLLVSGSCLWQPVLPPPPPLAPPAPPRTENGGGFNQSPQPQQAPSCLPHGWEDTRTRGVAPPG